MQIGDLVEIIAPESLTGYLAGKVGFISGFPDVSLENMAIVSVFANHGIEEAYLRRDEIKILSP